MTSLVYEFSFGCFTYIRRSLFVILVLSVYVRHVQRLDH